MKKTIISIFAVVIALASCQNLDFSRTDQVAASNVWGKATLARQAVNGIYSEFYDRNCTSVNEDSWRIMFEAYSSVMDTDKNWYHNQKVCYGDGTPASGQIASMFQYYYTFVFRANDVISHIGQVPDMSDEEKAKFIAEAKFFRAYAYYNLNVLWRGVPLYHPRRGWCRGIYDEGLVALHIDRYGQLERVWSSGSSQGLQVA